MERWDGKIALVTGASSGIGAAIAETLTLKYGVQVIGIGRRFEKLQTVAHRIQRQSSNSRVLFHAFKCDVTRMEDIAAVVVYLRTAQFKNQRCGIVVNNAGVVYEQSFTDGTDWQADAEKYRSVLDVHVWGACALTRALLASDLLSLDGHILNVSSLCSWKITEAMTNIGIYPAAKRALNAVSELMRCQMRNSAIRVTTLCPGLVRTEAVVELMHSTSAANLLAIEVEDFVNAVIFVLATPQHVEISNLSIRHIAEVE